MQTEFWFIKAKLFCVSTHVGGQSLFQSMHDYHNSQAINTYIYNHTEALTKIYFHAGQYAKITYKMSLSLSKIVFIQ